MRPHLKELGDSLVATVKTFVAHAAAGLSARIDDLDERLKAIPAGADGAPGPAGAAGEKGDPGDPGQDGKDGAPGATGERGQPGEKGDPGQDGKSITVGDVRPLLDDALAAVRADASKALDEAVKALPAPKDGRDGADGKSVTLDEVKALLDPMVAGWALDFERRAQDLLQKAIDRMPAPKDGRNGINGKDGADGFSLDDLTFDDDGDGTVTLRFVRGDLVREKAIRYPRGDRGVFRESEPYRKDDGVTFGGSFWIAQKDAPEGKPGLSSDWRLAVKKGRDGKDGEKGADGKNGRDLTKNP